MSVSFYDLLKFAKTGIASPSMTHYDKMKALAMCKAGFPVKTLTGVPPISFQSDGTALTAWSISGAMTQTGTPTPTVPIQPEECGDPTANLLDFNALKTAPSSTLSGYTFSHVLTLTVKPNTYYTCVSNGTGNTGGDVDTNRCVYFNGSGTVSVVYNNHSVTSMSDSNGVIIIAFESSRSNATQYLNGSAQIWLVEGTAALPYEPFGYKIPLTNAGQTIPVYLGEVPTVRRVRKLVLTGSETIAGSAVTGGWVVTIYPSTSTAVNTADSITAFCSHYKSVGNTGIANLSNGEMCVSVSRDTWLLFATGYSTKEDFAQFLADEYSAGHPVTVWYVLATEQTGIVNEPLCKIGTYADELHSGDAAVTIPTAKGQNTLTVDTELQPSEISITGGIK